MVDRIKFCPRCGSKVKVDQTVLTYSTQTGKPARKYVHLVCSRFWCRVSSGTYAIVREEME